MKSKKELYYSNIKDLTEEEIEKLADYELNCCDKCGEVDNSEELYWLEYCDLSEEEYMLKSSNGIYTALCSPCYENAKKVECHCNICKRGD